MLYVNFISIKLGKIQKISLIQRKMAFGNLGNCVKYCKSQVHVALSTCSSNLNLDARIPMNTEADCENNNKLTGYCLKRGTHQLGLPINCRQIKDVAGGSLLPQLKCPQFPCFSHPSPFFFLLSTQSQVTCGIFLLIYRVYWPFLDC